MIDLRLCDTKRARSIVGTGEAGRPKDDYYPTPTSATDALLDAECFTGPIWEPACGNGAISTVIEARGFAVVSTDLYDHGYGVPDIDFLKTTEAPAYTIITNPPFCLAENFIRHACFDLRVSRLALLLKLAFLEGQRRSRLLESTPLARVWVFRNRLTMTRNGEPMRGGGMIAFAWFVWDAEYSGHPAVHWLDTIKAYK